MIHVVETDGYADIRAVGNPAALGRLLDALLRFFDVGATDGAVANAKA